MLCRSLEDNVENTAEDGGLVCEISEGKFKTLKLSNSANGISQCPDAFNHACKAW